MRWLNLAMLLTVMHDESAHLPDGEQGQAGTEPRTADAAGGEDWLALALEQLQGAAPQAPQMPPWLQVFHQVLHAGVLRRQGQGQAAVAELRDALAHSSPRPDSLTRYARQELAQALAQHGSTRDEAQALAEGLLREAREAPGAGTSMWQIENVAQLAELAGRPDEALRAQQRGMALLRRNAVALLEAQQDGLSSRVDAQAQRLLNADLEQRNRDLARRVQDVTHAARYDALTGVLNRRGLEQAFGRAQGREGFALLLADLDEFKQINDERSHLVGDSVLRRVGALLQEHLREPDAVGRWGGEEFLLVLHGCDAEQAQTIAERLRDRVASAPWDELGAGLKVTVSIGWTLAGPAEAMDAVVARADAALYRAKGEGRNRVCPG
jgi:diguanylate cyclase (GGDEF)-like protein